MGLLDLLFGGPVESSQEDLEKAEQYLSSKCNDEHITALVRHYDITEVTDDIERRTGAKLNDGDTVKIVQGLRDQYGMGSIAEYNMPGHIDSEEHLADKVQMMAYNTGREIERRNGGLIGWLLG